MVETVNILGDTQKQQWMSAVSIFHLAIQANIEFAVNELSGGMEDRERAIVSDEVLAALDNAHEQVGVFADEMRRLVKGVCDG